MAAIDRLLADCKTMDDFGEMLSEDDIDQIHDGNRVLTENEIHNLFWKSGTPETLGKLLGTLVGHGVSEDEAIDIISSAFHAGLYECGH